MSIAPAVFQFDDRNQCLDALIGALSVATKNAIETKGFANIALSGGSTPEPAYTKFANEDFDWSKVTIALVDERWVDVNDDASNEKMIRRAFANAKGVKIVGMKTDDATPQEAAVKLDEIYKKLRPFDAIILGMGPDAHTASWFSGANGLDEILNENCAQNIAPIDASHSEVGGKYPHRLTMTLPPIVETQMLLGLIFGHDKLEVLEHCVAGDARSMPIKAAIDAARHGLAFFWAP